MVCRIGGSKVARHTFVTESHTFGDEKKTVEILSRSEVRAIVEDVVAELQRGIEEINEDKQRIWDILDQFKPRPPHGTKGAYEKTVREFRDAALAAAKDATEAKASVERLVETARVTFRDVIAELLEPHYRLLAQHLGIELPTAAAKLKVVEKKLPASARNTTKPDSAGSHRAEGTEKKRRNAGVKASKKKSTTKATATVRRTKTKGARSCPKK